MIRRTTPQNTTQNWLNVEESFTGKKGIDITQAPVSRDTVYDMVNMDVDLDGAMTIRKPIKSLDILPENRDIIYTKEIFDNSYFYIIQENGDLFIGITNSTPIYIKDGTSMYRIYDYTNIKAMYIDLENAVIVNTNTSSLITNVKIDLSSFMNGSHYSSSVRIRETVCSLRLYKKLYNNTEVYAIEYLDPYVATLEASDTLTFNPNTAGNYTYALTDTYDNTAVRVNGILAYTNGTASDVKGLTETDKNGHFIISSINSSYNNPIILKAFCNFIKDTDVAKYYCAWEYSFDGVTWETLPEFRTKWKNNSSYKTINVQNLASVNYALTTDTKTVYNTIIKEVMSLNVISNSLQDVNARPDIITLSTVNKAVYRFVIYRQYEYFNDFSSKTINTLANVTYNNFTYFPSYTLLRTVDTTDNNLQNFSIDYRVPINFSEVNLTCKLITTTDGSDTIETNVFLRVTVVSTNTTNGYKIIRVRNNSDVEISPPTVENYIGATGKTNAILTFYYVDNNLFDIITYQVVYIKSTPILDSTALNNYANSIPALIPVDTYDINISESYIHYFNIDIKFDASLPIYLISNSVNQTDHTENENINYTVYSIDTLKDYLNIVDTNYILRKKLRIIPCFKNDVFKNTIGEALSGHTVEHITFSLINSNTNTLVSQVNLSNSTQINLLLEECNNFPLRGNANTIIGYQNTLEEDGYEFQTSKECCILNALLDTNNNAISYPDTYLYLDVINEQYYVFRGLTLSAVSDSILSSSKHYNLEIDKTIKISDYTDTVKIADVIGNQEYSFIHTNTTEILNTDFVNSNIGKKLYYKYRLYSYGDSSFKNNIYVSDTDSLITPLLNAIDLPIVENSIITSIIPWRDYLIASSEQGIFLITPTENGFTTKIITTFVGIPYKDGDTLKSILNGAIFKSGSKVYILQPSLYASTDNTINILDISKSISSSIIDTEYNNFAFTTEQYYYLCIPDTTTTTVLKYEFATKRWTKHLYPDRFISAHIISLDDIRIITPSNIYQFDRNFSTYKSLDSNLVGYGDIINDIVVPISYTINTGPKSYSMQYPHQFAESKILFSVLDDANAQLPLVVDIYADNFKLLLHTDPSTSNTLWRDTVVSANLDTGIVFTLSSDAIADEDIHPVMKQLFLRYSGKGYTVTHIIKGNSNCFFKCYVIYTRFKETINKK